MLSKFKMILILLLLLISKINYAQNIEIKPYAGLNSTLGDFKNFSQNGNDFGLSADYFLTSKFALGIDVNYQDNKLLQPFLYANIPEDPSAYAVQSVNLSKWNALTIGLGPTYRLGTKKFTTDIYAKVGFSMLTTPKSTFAFSTIDQEKDLFRLEEQNQTSFGLTSGVRFNYAISKIFSVFANTQHVFLSSKLNYFYTDISPSFITDDNQSFFDPGTLIEQPSIKKEFNPSYFNLNFGVSFSLGKDTKKRKYAKESEDKNQKIICNNSELLEPYDGANFNNDSKKTIEFKWLNFSNPKVKNYLFELYHGQEVIYSKELKSQTIKFDKKMIKGIESEEDRNYYTWKITTFYNNCKKTSTDYNRFSISNPNRNNRSECKLKFTNIDISCNAKPYDGEGNVKYSGTFTIKNEASIPAILIPSPLAANNPSQLFDINTSGVLTYSQSMSIGSSCFMTPLVSTPYGLALAPNNSATYCFELTVPFTTTNVIFLANSKTYTNGELLPATCPTNELIELPNCVCDTCESWDFTDQRYSFIYDGANNNPYLSHMIFQSFKLPGTAPIRKMNAEIVYLKHTAGDEKCYSCTTEVKDMGLFSQVNAKAKDVLAQPFDWNNNQYANIGLDKNNDQYSNMLTWGARNPITGVDFSTRRHNFQLFINLPGDNSFSCCSHEYEVWIRYTFEDIDCNTCSTLVKYNLTGDTGNSSGSSSNPGNIGNTGNVNHNSKPLNIIPIGINLN